MPQKRRKIDCLYKINLEYLTLDEAIECLQKIKRAFECEKYESLTITGDVDDSYGFTASARVAVLGHRLETDEEFAKRERKTIKERERRKKLNGMPPNDANSIK